MKKIKVIALATVAAFMLTTLSASSFAESGKITYTLEEDKSAVPNPHKGWVQYVYDPWFMTSEECGMEANRMWDFTTVVYSRFTWYEIEPHRGEYNWEPIDELLTLCKDNGKTFSFGVIPSDSLSYMPDGYVPSYVFDEGCRYVIANANTDNETPQRTPVWDDEIYLYESKRLINALAERYDGNEAVEFIDIRTLGNWGEWHTYGLNGSEMPSDEVQMDVLDAWAEAFNTTRLVLPVNGSEITPVSEYAVTLGITLRRDGLVGLPGHENALSPAWENKLPPVGEFCYGYDDMVQKGQWTLENLKKVIKNGHLEYLAMGSSALDGVKMNNDNKELIEELQNYIGYNFVMQKANLEFNGKKATLSFRVKNTGASSQPFPMWFMVAFTDENGKVLKKLKLKASVAEGGFTSGTARSYKFTFKKSSIPDSAYISVGIFESPDDVNPTVRFANTSTCENNWLLLGSTEK